MDEKFGRTRVKSAPKNNVFTKGRWWNTEEMYRRIWIESKPLRNPKLIKELVLKKKLVFRKRKIPRTPFHLVDPRPWPLCAAICAMG